MNANVGDRLVISGHHVGEHEREAQILEVRGAAGAPPYLVRWVDDGHVEPRSARDPTRWCSTSSGREPRHPNAVPGTIRKFGALERSVGSGDPSGPGPRGCSSTLSVAKECRDRRSAWHLVFGEGVDGPAVEHRANDRLLERVTCT